MPVQCVLFLQSASVAHAPKQKFPGVTQWPVWQSVLKVQAAPGPPLAEPSDGAHSSAQLTCRQ